jgi:hypothetical protein
VDYVGASQSHKGENEMSGALTPKEIAIAAAQGVAIALSARKPKPGAPTEELFFRPPLVCGIPPAIFEVDIKPNPDGTYTLGGIVSQ